MTQPAGVPGSAPATKGGRSRQGRDRPGSGRDGARGGEPRGGRAAQLPYLIVVAIAAAGLGWIWQGGDQRARGGTLAVAGALLVAALARLVLPDGRAGMLVSRGRFTDVVTLAALAAGLLAAGLLLPTPP